MKNLQRFVKQARKKLALFSLDESQLESAFLDSCVRIFCEKNKVVPEKFLLSSSPAEDISPRALFALADETTVPDDWSEPEAVGWLHQFFVRGGKTPNRQGVVDAADKRSLTQLFTPGWLASYLIENSLGVRLAEIFPESEFLRRLPFRVSRKNGEKSARGNSKWRMERVRQVTFLDPSCGTGHLLLAAYRIFDAVYRELGLPENLIPSTILERNLFGLDLDPAAVRLARILLSLAAVKKSPDAERPPEGRIFSFEESPLPDAQILGSLWRPETVSQNGETVSLPIEKILRREFDVVAANPPYLGRKGMAEAIKEDARRNGRTGDRNLYSLFVERSLELAKPGGFVGILAMESWMSLPTFMAFRRKILAETTLLSLLHLGTGAFSTIGGEVVAAAAFSLRKETPKSDHRPIFFRLTDGDEAEKRRAFLADSQRFESRTQVEFLADPEAALRYEISERLRRALKNEKKLADAVTLCQGMATGDNRRFLRRWFEVDRDRIAFGLFPAEAAKSTKKWFPYHKGNGDQRWFQEDEFVIDWENDGKSVRATRPRAVVRNPDYFFREAVRWSFVRSGPLAARWADSGALFDVGASSLFPEPKKGHPKTGPSESSRKKSDFETLAVVLGYLNSSSAASMAAVLNPTLNFQVGDLARLPFDLEKIGEKKREIVSLVQTILRQTRDDRRSRETSPEFRISPLLADEGGEPTLEAKFGAYQKKTTRRTETVRRLEEKNNRLFSTLCGLEGEDSDAVSRSAVTLFSNPNYRFASLAPNRRANAFRRETMADFFSFFVGVALGRFPTPFTDFPPPAAKIEDSLLPRLAAIRNDGFFRLPDKNFSQKNAPILIALEEFLSRLFGRETLKENLRFLADSLAVETLADWLAVSFTEDHRRRYENRPIYWQLDFGHSNGVILFNYHRLDAAMARRIGESIRRKDRAISWRLTVLTDFAASLDRDEGVEKNLHRFKTLLDGQNDEGRG